MHPYRGDEREGEDDASELREDAAGRVDDRAQPAVRGGAEEGVADERADDGPDDSGHAGHPDRARERVEDHRVRERAEVVQRQSAVGVEEAGAHRDRRRHDEEHEHVQAERR